MKINMRQNENNAVVRSKKVLRIGEKVVPLLPETTLKQKTQTNEYQLIEVFSQGIGNDCICWATIGNIKTELNKKLTN